MRCLYPPEVSRQAKPRKPTLPPRRPRTCSREQLFNQPINPSINRSIKQHPIRPTWVTMLAQNTFRCSGGVPVAVQPAHAPKNMANQRTPAISSAGSSRLPTEA